MICLRINNFIFFSFYNISALLMLCLSFISGGTADISVHEKLANGKLKPIHEASGGPWGGIYVDQAYMAMIQEVFGDKAIKALKDDEMGDYVDLLREFETKKRDFSLKKKDMVTFRISAALRESFEKGALKEKISGLPYGSGLELRGLDKLRVEPKIIQSWFDGPLDHLVQHVKEILREPNMRKVESILLVGGFGESPYAQERMALEFPEYRIIVPKDAGIVVLKGAVACGHDLDLACSGPQSTATLPPNTASTGPGNSWNFKEKMSSVVEGLRGMGGGALVAGGLFVAKKLIFKS